MNDLISRRAAIDALNERCESECEYSKKQRSVMCNACYLGSAKEVVKDLPTIDPVKHGEWILLPSELVSDDGLWGETRYACSNCGYERHVKYQFCPNCGAMMDGKEQKSYADWVVKRE